MPDLTTPLDELNPWGALPKHAPFVLAADAVAVDRFNEKAVASVRIELSLVPEPYVGRIDAPVILLTLNPGVSGEDFALHENPAFRERVLRCHRQAPTEYPNYYLDPAVAGPGARWLHRITRPLVQEFGARAVSSGLSLVELFPYHSRRFAHGAVRVPSQAYTIAIVQAAIRRGAAIFITRGRELWYKSVPDLRNCSRVFFTRSTQNIVISPKNCPDGFSFVADAIGRLGS